MPYSFFLSPHNENSTILLIYLNMTMYDYFLLWDTSAETLKKVDGFLLYTVKIHSDQGCQSLKQTKWCSSAICIECIMFKWELRAATNSKLFNE